MGSLPPPCQKRLCNIKYGFERSISNVDIAWFNQVTVNVSCYDILVLQNHSTAFEICVDTQQCRGISMFLVSALAKKCRSDWILRNYKNYFSKKKKKYTFVQERKEMLHSIKKLFLFSLQFLNWISSIIHRSLYYLFIVFLLLVFNKRAIEIILILPYSYKLQKIKKWMKQKAWPIRLWQLNM